MKQCLQSVNHKQFPIQMTQQQAQQVAGDPRFSTETPWRTPTKIHREQKKNSLRAEKETTTRSNAQSTENIA